MTHQGPLDQFISFFRHLLSTIDALGFPGYLEFAALYIAGTLLFVPGSLLILAAGALFGFPGGFAMASALSLVSAGGMFLAGRHFSRNWLLKKIASDPRTAALDAAVTKEGWRMVLLLRIASILPFSLLNYVLGLSKIPLKIYLLATWIGMTPGILLYAYLGDLTGKMLFSNEPRRITAAEWVLFGIGLCAAAGITVYGTAAVKKVLKNYDENR